MKSLQHKILLFITSLILLVQSIVFYTNYINTTLEETRKTKHLVTTAEQNFKNQYERRSYYLQAFAETAAKDFALKQVFEEDTRSLFVALNNHRQRIDADMVIAVSAKGTVIAQLLNLNKGGNQYKVEVGPEQNQAFGYMKWFQLPNTSFLYEVGNNIFQISFSPIKSGQLIIGWVAFGYIIDEKLAIEFSKLNGLETEFIINDNDQLKLISTSLQSTPNKNLDIFKEIITNSNTNKYISTVYTVGHIDGKTLLAVMYGTRSDLLLSIQDRWQELLLLAALLLLSSLLAAYWIAVKISAPVKILVEQVKAITDGNYSATLEFSSNDELGQLAEEFNLMKDAINKREQTISLQAFHDQLTKLPNRYSLLKTLEKWLTSFSEPFAVIRISPQRMKEVNYSLGHDVGDDVIIELANRLMFCSENNYIYNVGGSSFVLIVKGVNKVKLNHFLTEIEEIMEAEFKLKNILLNIQIKMGISLYPDHSSNNQELLAMASTALQYAQKKNVHHIIYEEHLSSLTIERLHLINGLKSAISENQLVLFYQPKLDLKKGLVTEVEALVRWIHPEHGLIPPDNFISLAEQTGYIHQLTAWVIDTALAQYKLWRHQGIKLAIAVNVSAENLKLTNFYENVIILLEKHNLTPEALCIEITESVVLEDPDATIELLTRFKNRGFHLSVDDYGTGYSSLAQLTKLPVCEMKIDKAFVSDLIDKQENRVIVDSTISLAHALNLNVVAEGIEDQATLEWLTNNNCDMAQGYFISKPKPIDELNTWLAQSKYFHTKPNLVRLKDE